MSRISSSFLFRSIVVAVLVFVFFSTLSRVALMLLSMRSINWDLSLLGALLTGLFSDVIASIFACVPWLLLSFVTPRNFWRGKVGRWSYFVFLMLYAAGLIFISSSEWLFWDEFGVRFNFIAVDYLVFTTEVVENIQQSYPMIWIFSGIILLSFGFVIFLHRMKVIQWVLFAENPIVTKCVTAFFMIALMVMAVLGFSQSSLPTFANTYHGELAKNGCWSFFAAYQKMEIDYDQWYLTLPIDQAKDRVRKLVSTSEASYSADPDEMARTIKSSKSEKRWNVIIVCMESMSADLMHYAGNTKGLTPRLDELAKNSLFFSNLRATGTRTVRGMEALTLNLPPTPGQAIFYRPDGVDLNTTFAPFLDRGYDCAFIYGGHGQFDYMNRYFSTSGCRVVDLGSWSKSEVTMKTAWGACDEDLFHKAIAEADQMHAKGQPFHFFCMTTSNHRPYDFPDGRIVRKSQNGRESAVQYADWAIGDLIDRSKTKPWYKNTLFVICADHCASSAGKAELDVTKYHIPAMVYNPDLVPAQTIDRLCSQIDVMPTVFSLLGWQYQNLGFGQNQLDPEVTAKPARAFISNYQKIALLQDRQLAILKPNRELSLYQCQLAEGELTTIPTNHQAPIVQDAISYYQTASWLFKSGKLKRKKSP